MVSSLVYAPGRCSLVNPPATVCPQPLMIPTLAFSWHCASLVALGLPCLQRTSGATLGPRVARCSSGAGTTSSPRAPSSMPGFCGSGTALTRSYVPIAHVPSGCPHCMGTLGAVWCKREQAAPLKGHWTFLGPRVLYCLQGSQQPHLLTHLVGHQEANLVTNLLTQSHTWWRTWP